jgi:hypothetical protein
MPEDRFPVLFLDGATRTTGFTSPQQGGAGRRPPERVREDHAEMVRQKLESAWEEDRNRLAAAHSNREGCYLEFVGCAGEDLAVKSLEFLPAGIRLRNVRTEQTDQGERTLATVYVPAEKRGHFLRKIRAYETEDDPRSGRPKNERLIASIEDVRTAILDEFWTDPSKSLPVDHADWVEIWVAGNSEVIVGAVRDTLERLGIEEHHDRPLLTFPERAILLARANREQLVALIESSDHIAELRGARELATFFVDQPNREQAEWCLELLGRLQIESAESTAVCILDTGVNRDHPLIDPLLSPNDLHSYDATWGTSDHDKHGTLMAGVCGFGDLQKALESGLLVSIRHVLESVKILPPPPARNPKHLWGHVTAQGISRAEIEAADRRRVVCLAVTSEETRDGGHPSSWSAELDSLASGDQDGRKRLIVISAGNITDPAEWANHPEAGMTNEVHDPAQAWNCLTVGACTFLTRIETPSLADYEPIASIGERSPFSTTSSTWEHRRWPIKPEVMFEGGNAARVPGYHNAQEVDDLSLVSTWHRHVDWHLAPFSMTSAAAAQAAWMAARIQAEYPEAWPETVRGLLVHSASWTEAMKAGIPSSGGASRYRVLLRTCGYGVPNLERALSCARNSLTLIAQEELQPFERKANGTYGSKDMHLYRLPWPDQILLDLGEIEVSMRVTLSYFVEPGPGEVGWGDRYRYPSHGLRFELNSPGEDAEVFLRRINTQAREDDEDRPDTVSPRDHWVLGKQRDVGSIHSDIWKGRAADLASSNLIAVRPSIGWWRERHHLGRVDTRCRYSLIVSIETLPAEVDIYTPIAVQIGIPTPVPIEIPV